MALKERHALTLSDFRGVDFSSSPLAVESFRATGMQNFINRDGQNRKRHGWKELDSIIYAEERQRINGIFVYNKDGAEVFIVHAGCRFYLCEESAAKGGCLIKEDITPEGDRITDTKSQAFYQKGKIYIIGCGDFLVYGKWENGAYEMRRVADGEGTYIPTTSHAILTLASNGVTMYDYHIQTQTQLDDVNMLTRCRKNTFIAYELDSEDSFTATLDALPVPLTFIKVSFEDHVILSTLLDAQGEYVIRDEEEKLVGITVSQNKVTIRDAEKDKKYTVEYYARPQGDGESYEDRITGCSFGTLFGAGGNTDRLFLSGNSKHGNMDWFSAPDDFTYFPDLNYTALGSDDASITGYARLSDSTLAIFKENTRVDPTVFYRTGEYSVEFDEETGMLSNVSGVFPITAGSIGEGCISYKACANLAGDVLMLSKNGVFGIELTSNVATNERYARLRSRSITSRLTGHKNLSEAVATVLEGRYYLAVDGICYVADARYKYRAADDIDGTWGYEWWFETNMPVRVFSNSSVRLIFGTEDGRVCVFDDKFTDRTQTDTLIGELTLNYVENHVANNADIKVYEGDEVIFELPVYALADEPIYNDGTNYYAKYFERIYAGQRVFISGAQEYSATVCDVDPVNRAYALCDEQGNRLIPEDGVSVYINFSVSDDGTTHRRVVATDIKDGSFKLKAPETDELYHLSAFGGSVPIGLTARITHAQNVVAKWYTPIFNMGTDEQGKSLLKMTVGTCEGSGSFSFGYETRLLSAVSQARTVNGFSFEDLSFKDFSFETGFASSYSKAEFVRDFNYIIFRFISENDKDCIVNSFTTIYKYNKANKGVR